MPKPLQIEYRQAPDVDPEDAQRRLRIVYRILLSASRRHDPRVARLLEQAGFTRTNLPDGHVVWCLQLN